MISALRDAASAAGENAVASADLAGLGALADRLDEAALLVIAFTLRRSGLFPDPAATHSLQDVFAATKAAPRHHRIVRRWLAVLLRENMITLADGRYRDLRAVEAAGVERALAGLDAAARGFAHGPGLTRFFQQSAAYLPDLLTDAISLQALLFAGDDLDVADDVYRRNLASRYTNQAAAAVIRDFVRQRQHPAKVLEVGAGVGGTTAEVLPELDGLSVDYLFTDVTRYFLTVAEERFGSRIRYGIFDINAAEQQIPAHSMDVVLAANVLHNARHAGRVLGGLRELLAPGGLLVFIETCRDHYQLMTSMQFLMSPPASSPDADFEDFRRGTDRIFPSRQEWLSELESAGLREAFAVPEADHPLTRIGQHVFIATA